MFQESTTQKDLRANDLKMLKSMIFSKVYSVRCSLASYAHKGGYGFDVLQKRVSLLLEQFHHLL
jgi:hypothetical protein